MTMHQPHEVWEPSDEEKQELADSFFLGWDEASMGYPCDPPTDKSPREAREYVRGWSAKRFEVAGERRTRHQGALG